MRVYLESAEENMVPKLALEAVRVLANRQDGCLRPQATARSVGAFLDAWRSNDPNGGWGYATEIGDTLVCSRNDSDDPADEFPRSGETSAGERLYDLTGWAWVAVDAEF